MGIASAHRDRTYRIRGGLSVFRTVHGTHSAVARVRQVLRDIRVGRRVQVEQRRRRRRRRTAGGRRRPAGRPPAGRPRRRKVQGIIR